MKPACSLLPMTVRNRADLYNYLNWLQRRRETAETVRLLYVGVTRACKRAWLSGGCQIEQDEASTIKWPGPSTPLGLLKEAVAAQVHLHSADTSGHWVEEAVAVEPAPGVGQPALWRLPAEALPAPGRLRGPTLSMKTPALQPGAPGPR